MVVEVGYDLAEAIKPGDLLDKALKEGEATAGHRPARDGRDRARREARLGADSGADWKEAFLSLHLGRPLLGQRVGDLLSVIAATGR